jgi:hypothetical protein
MQYLIYHYPAHAAEAKAYAAPLRHRRHKVQLRDVLAALHFLEIEACDRVVIMVGNDEIVPGEIIALYSFDGGPELISVRPGDELPEPTEDEAKAMNPMNALRHEAALLGIAVAPEWTEQQLAERIAEAAQRQREAEQAEERRAQQIAREADEAARAREGGGTAGAAADVAPVTPPAAPAKSKEEIDAENAAEAQRLIDAEEAKLAAAAAGDAGDKPTPLELFAAVDKTDTAARSPRSMTFR